MALVNDTDSNERNFQMLLFSSFNGESKGTATPPLNCNINSGVRWEHLAGPASLRIERRTGNADVRAIHQKTNLMTSAREKFLKVAYGWE